MNRFLLIVAALASILVPLRSEALGIMVPAYFYPTTGGYWDSLDQTAGQVPLVAILNPDSGPGSAKDANYVTALAHLHAAGGKVIAYVHTSYGARPRAEVEHDIALYLRFYTVDGFFIDEMADDQNTKHLAYYAAIYQYIKGKNATFIVTGNPGTNTQEDYLKGRTVDSLMIFEDDGTSYSKFVPSKWVANYPAQDFVHVIYNVGTDATMAHDIRLAVNRHAGWIYVTDDTLVPDPYDRLPSYFTEEVSLVKAINAK